MSITIPAIAMMIVLQVFTWIGIEIGSAELNNFVQTGGKIILGFIAWYGRWRKGDVKWFGGSNSSSGKR